MRGLLLVPLVVLGMATTSVRSQPGPEVPPPPATTEAPVATGAPVIEPPAGVAPIASPGRMPAMNKSVGSTGTTLLTMMA